MKVLTSLILLSIVIRANAQVNSLRKFEFLSCAFKDITKQICIFGCYKICVVNFQADARAVEAVVLKNLISEETPYEFTSMNRSSFKSFFAPPSVNNLMVAMFELNDSAIITTDSVKSLNHFFRFFDTRNDLPKRFQFFVLCFEATYEDIVSAERVYRTVNKLKPLVEFLYFVVEEENFIKLLTFVWYSSGMCNVPQLVEVNSFSKRAKKWNSSEFSMKKFHNFHGCELVVLATEEYPHFDYKSHSKSSSHFLKLHKNILEGLSNHLQFRILYNTTKPKFQNEFHYDLNTYITEYNIYRRYTDTQIGSGSFITRPYFFVDLRLAVPIGYEYNGY